LGAIHCILSTTCQDYGATESAITAIHGFEVAVNSADEDLAVRLAAQGVHVLMMLWYAMLGRFEDTVRVAISILNVSRKRGTVGVVWAWLWGPEMRNFRQSPGFQSLIARLGWMEYWERFGPPDGCELRNGGLICG
jgi:hypothetical protein